MTVGLTGRAGVAVPALRGQSHDHDAAPQPVGPSPRFEARVSLTAAFRRQAPPPRVQAIVTLAAPALGPVYYRI
jgi:hypothetical protein